MAFNYEQPKFIELFFYRRRNFLGRRTCTGKEQFICQPPEYPAHNSLIKKGRSLFGLPQPPLSPEKTRAGPRFFRD
jgi:hypothetical protein